jgi:hypothetical protein
MNDRTKMKTVADVLHWEPYLNDEQLAELRKVACPAKIGRKQAPQDLNDITLGQLIQLEAIAAEKGVFAAIAEVLLDKDEAWAMKAPAMEMLGLRNMVVAEQDRIAALFASLTRDHTAAEIMAGIESLNFGMFGLADWYARRMGIHDHDDAFNTPWLRIWQCRKNDIEEAEYQKRLQKIKTNLAKSQSKK